MSRVSIAEWCDSLVAREPLVEKPAMPECMSCHVPIMDVSDRTARQPFADDNHETPWTRKEVSIPAEDREGVSCEACYLMFRSVNSRPHFVRAQEEFYADRVRRRKLIKGDL